MKTKLSFKKQPRSTGLAGIGYPYPNVDIKINKIEVGYIHAPTWQSPEKTWSIHIQVTKTEPDDNPNCEWKWLTFAQKFPDEESARAWLKENIDEIVEKYNIYME